MLSRVISVGSGANNRDGSRALFFHGGGGGGGGGGVHIHIFRFLLTLIFHNFIIHAQ